MNIKAMLPAAATGLLVDLLAVPVASRSHLAYAQPFTPKAQRLLAQLNEAVKADCDYQAVSP